MLSEIHAGYLCHRGRVAAVLAMFIVMALGGAIVAQEVTGTILGTVTDNSGAVVPGAKVTITNTDRGAVLRVVTTNKGGDYSAPQLPIGKYMVTVEAAGFKKVSEVGDHAECERQAHVQRSAADWRGYRNRLGAG
ncbi:carboxypeptidase-like regulatory domain-containing protein [Acidobacterium sp. S8]|uniref:carboxypeptidase-like regulatory domain-containing protein n=1 Tax=Acidobacterium sp. S8 TaxID=1641854 RepID=UPI00131D1D97|nr:carboxypeptidase-like regulatory domain-containing protein [Acidobacterium sp. S8]